MNKRQEKLVQRKKRALFFSVFFIWFSVMLSPVLVGLNDVGNLGFVTQEVWANEQAAVAERDFWDFGGKILDAVGSAIISTGALITYAGGSLFEKAVEIFVAGFGTLIAGDSLGGTASSDLREVIDTIWKLVRDVSNLIFIFGFLYIGILLIYNADSSSARKSLAGLIVAALLVNFSLFITKFVIEFFNLLSYAIYSQMTNGGTTQITAAIMNNLGLPTLYGPPSTSFLANMTGGGTFWFFVMAFVFMIITAFVFFSGALMLLVRFVALLFIMMFSPILFAAMVFPQTASYAKKMWRYLFDYSIFAPAYLFLLFVAISVLGGLNLAGEAGFDDVINSIDSPSENRSDAYMVVLNFVVAIIVIQYAGSLAKKMGLAGGDLAVSIANKGKKVAAAATVGMAARAGRASLGRVAYNISEKEGLKETASKRGWRGSLARGALSGTRSVADSSFDARSNLSKETAKKLGVGDGGKGGYKTRLDTMKKKEEEFGKSLGTLDDADARVKGRKQEQEQLQKELRDLKAEKAVAKTAEEHKEWDQKIFDKEKEIAEKKREYEQEKQRRQIGSTYKEYESGTDNGGRVEEHKKLVETQKKELGRRWDEYREGSGYMNEAQKIEELKSIQKEEDKLKNLKKEEQRLLNELTKNGEGYASVLETAGKLGSWIKGQQVSQRKAVGSAMRKAHIKGLPKEKEERSSSEDTSKKEDGTK